MATGIISHLNVMNNLPSTGDTLTAFVNDIAKARGQVK
jgi:hypothetical protein